MTTMLRHVIVATLCLQAFEVIVLEAAKQNVQLSDSYLPVAMQVIAHLTDQMSFAMHEESEANPPKPTTKPTTTPKPLDETTPFHRPGYYAPVSPPKPSERISPQKHLQQNDSAQNQQNNVSPQDNQQNPTPQQQQYPTPQNQQQHSTQQDQQQYSTPQNQQQYPTPQNQQQYPTSHNQQQYPTSQSQQQYPTSQNQQQYPIPQNQQQYPTSQNQQQYPTPQSQQQYPTPQNQEQYPNPQQQHSTPQNQQQYTTPQNQNQYATSQVQQQYSYPSQQQPYNFPTQDQQQYYFPSQNQPQYNFPSQYPEQYNVLSQNQQTYNFQESQNQNEFSQNQQVFNVSLQDQYLNNDYQQQYNIFQNQQQYNTPQNQQFNVMTFDLPQYNPLQPQSVRNEEPLLSAHHEEVKPLMEPTPDAPQLLPPHFESDVDKISSRSKGFDVDELTEDNLQYLSHNVREMLRMAHDPHDERLVDVWEGLRARPLEPAPKGKMSASNLRLLLLYDLLSREAKRQKLSDYSGFSPDVMKTLVESSSGGARAQLKMALSKMVERHDCAHEYANNRAKEMVTELGKDDSKLSSEIRYLQPLVYKY